VATATKTHAIFEINI